MWSDPFFFLLDYKSGLYYKLAPFSQVSRDSPFLFNLCVFTEGWFYALSVISSTLVHVKVVGADHKSYPFCFVFLAVYQLVVNSALQKQTAGVEKNRV